MGFDPLRWDSLLARLRHRRNNPQQCRPRYVGARRYLPTRSNAAVCVYHSIFSEPRSLQDESARTPTLAAVFDGTCWPFEVILIGTMPTPDCLFRRPTTDRPVEAPPPLSPSPNFHRAPPHAHAFCAARGDSDGFTRGASELATDRTTKLKSSGGHAEEHPAGQLGALPARPSPIARAFP